MFMKRKFILGVLMVSVVTVNTSTEQLNYQEAGAPGAFATDTVMVNAERVAPRATDSSLPSSLDLSVQGFVDCCLSWV